MDGNHSSGYSNNYGHSWNHGQDHPEGGDGDVPLDSLSDITLTGSQTQAIASIMETHPALLYQVSAPNSQMVEDISMTPDMFAEPSLHDFGSYHHNHQYEGEHLVHQQAQHNFNQNILADQAALPALPSSSLVHGVPATDKWPGPLDYCVEFSKAQDKTKATPWVYSTKLDKLFVSMDKACPINFKIKNVSSSYFSQYQIRGQMVYSRPEDFQDPVERCVNHQNKDVASALNSAHVLRCDDANAHYFVHENKRHSVVVPLMSPAPGTQSVTFCFRFMCLSSCIGSLNRRPTKLIFTLEKVDGSEMGRYACPVRICSCPGRDVRSEEEKMAEETTAVQQNNSQVLTESPLTGNTDGTLIPIHFPPVGYQKGKSKKRKATTTAVTTTTGPQAPARPINGQGEVFNLNVNIRGRHEFEAIRQMVENMLQVFEEQNARLASNETTNAPANTEPAKRFKEEP